MESPEMGGNRPEILQRPTEEEINLKIVGYNQTKEDSPMRYEDIIWELKDFAEGSGDQDVRDRYYRGWTNEDFRNVLKRLGE